MSPMQPDPTTQQQQQQGTETFLSPEERAQLKRLMGHPTDYPKEMMSHIREWLAVNPPDFVASQFKGKGVPRYLDRQTDALTSVGSTSTETTVYTYTLKEKTVSPTGQLRLLFFWAAYCGDVSNTVTIRVKLGASTVMSFAISTDSLDSNSRQGCADIKIVNAGAYNSQLGYLLAIQNTESGTYTDIKSIGSSSVDLSQDQELSITADWDSAGSQNFDGTYLALEVFNPVGN